MHRHMRMLNAGKLIIMCFYSIIYVTNRILGNVYLRTKPLEGAAVGVLMTSVWCWDAFNSVLYGYFCTAYF